MVNGNGKSQEGLQRSFWLLFSAASVSSMGDGLALVAFPLLAATLTRDPGLIAGVLFAQRLPWLVFALPAGALADRLPHGRTMAAADVVRMGLLGVVGVAVLTGRMSLAILYVVVFALGSLETLFAAAAHAALPALVEETELDRANGRVFATETAGEQLAGPAAGGILFSVAAAVPFLVDAVSFLLSAAFLARLRCQRATSSEPQGGTLRSEMASGMRLFWASPLLRVLSLTIGGLALCQAMVMSTFVLFALDLLHMTRAGYGLLLGVGAVGNVVGALMAPRIKPRLGTARVLTLGALGASAAYAVLGVTSQPIVAAAMLTIEAFVVACGSVACISLRQSCVPPDMLGRVGNAFRMCIWGAIPIGALAGGQVASHLGLRAPFFVAATAQVLLATAVATRLHELVGQVEGRPARRLTRELAPETATAAA